MVVGGRRGGEWGGGGGDVELWLRREGDKRANESAIVSSTHGPVYRGRITVLRRSSLMLVRFACCAVAVGALADQESPTRGYCRASIRCRRAL